ncbi:hypothetical protein GJ744_010236 [Endocarpon pusillum]|uniref:Uncharacterized protein n=1 Tax=Endocarpon pusillum TaxID=364733 RepID=A0A8H7AEX9_9EURO|nr:hypothetical protein GJ744_010236 [Endocarpon pusillum]
MARDSSVRRWPERLPTDNATEDLRYDRLALGEGKIGFGKRWACRFVTSICWSPDTSLGQQSL